MSHKKSSGPAFAVGLFYASLAHGDQHASSLGTQVAEKRPCARLGALYTKATDGLQRERAGTPLGTAKMIGLFLVLVATVCAVWRTWRDSLKNSFYGRRIGESCVNRSCNVTWVQYFIGCAEYWYWENTIHGEPATTDFRWLLCQPQKQRPHRVETALIEDSSGEVIDVTLFVRQLSGPGMDFYGRNFRDVEADKLDAYLTFRCIPDMEDWLDWKHCDVRIVPGSVMTPIRFTFDREA